MNSTNQEIANTRADAAALQFIKEVCSITGIISEHTFDELLDASIESMKANVDASNLNGYEKAQIKTSRELFMRKGSQQFKETMKLSGRIRE